MNKSLVLYEFKRIIKLPLTKIIILIGAVFPLIAALTLPYMDFETNSLLFGIKSLTTLSQIILMPAKAVAVVAVVSFSALTIYEFDKIFRFRVNYIIEPISSSIKIYLLKTTGIIFAGVICTLASTLIMIPYYIIKHGSFKDFSYLLICFFGIILAAIVLAVLMSAGFYLIFRKVNFTIIIMLLAMIFSFLGGNINYQYMWIQTGISGISENFGIGNNIIGMLWNRLFGLSVAMIIFLLGLMCNRCYEKGAFKSLIKNCSKHKIIIVCFLCSLIGSFMIFENEPIFIKVSPIDIISIFITGDKETPVNKEIKGTSDISVNLNIDEKRKYASGDYIQKIQNPSGKPQKIYFNLAYGYKLDEVTLDNDSINYTKVPRNNMNSAKIQDVYELNIPENTQSELNIKYSGRPKGVGLTHDFSLGISEEYINLNKSCEISPVVCIDQNNNKIEGNVKLDSKFTIITPGDQNNKISESDGLSEWKFSYDKPDSLSLTAGEYGKFERDVKGTKVEFFYPLSARNEFEDRGNDTLDIFSFFSDEYGPLRRNNLKVVITSGVFGGVGSQSENVSYISEDCITSKSHLTSEQASMADNFALLTHEIAHQWWGGGINVSNYKADNNVDNQHDEWTNDAFADFSSYLFLKHKFGKEYADDLFVEKWYGQVEELKRNFYERNPEYINKLSMLPKYNITIALRGRKMYGLGPYTVYKIYDEIGEEKFQEAMKNVYEKYYDKKDKDLKYTDFINITGINKEAVINE